MINEAKQINDPYANIIQSINYQNKSLKILLSFGLNEELIPIDVDIRFTAQQNAMNYYNAKKRNATKEEKTIKNVEEVLEKEKKKAEIR